MRHVMDICWPSLTMLFHRMQQMQQRWSDIPRVKKSLERVCCDRLSIERVNTLLRVCRGLISHTP